MQAHEPHAFRKSSHSAVSDCVAWAHVRGRVHVADSKDADGAVLETSYDDWLMFTASTLTRQPSAGALTWAADDLGVSVYLRSAADRRLRFTRSEWDAFVAGVVDDETCLNAL